MKISFKFYNPVPSHLANLMSGFVKPLSFLSVNSSLFCSISPFLNTHTHTLDLMIKIKDLIKCSKLVDIYTWRFVTLEDNFKIVVCFGSTLRILWINEYILPKLLSSFYHISLSSNYIQKEDQHIGVISNHLKGTQTGL